MKSITILFIVLLSNINLYSNQIYISTNGNDNFGNGTINSPFFSIQFVLDNKSIAGDELILREGKYLSCLLYTSPSPRDRTRSRMPSSA